MTACHFAAQCGYLEVVKLLVAHGANRQLRNWVSVTEVMRLCVNGLVYCMVTDILIVVMTTTVCRLNLAL